MAYMGNSNGAGLFGTGVSGNGGAGIVANPSYTYTTSTTGTLSSIYPLMLGIARSHGPPGPLGHRSGSGTR